MLLNELLLLTQPADCVKKWHTENHAKQTEISACFCPSPICFLTVNEFYSVIKMPLHKIPFHDVQTIIKGTKGGSVHRRELINNQYF